MSNFSRIVGFFWFITILAGCHRSVGIEFDAGTDATTQNDASQQEDAFVQNDASQQEDADIQPDADTAAGTLTYSVNHLHQPPVYIPIWDGAENEMTEVTLKNGPKEVTISSLTFKKIGSADASGLEDPILLLNGMPFQQTYEWTSPESLAFSFSLNLTAMEEVALKLKIRPEWQLCLNVAFDVDSDSDIIATTSGNQLPVIVTEHVNSMTPVPVFIYGFRFYLDAMTPAGSIFPGSNIAMIRYNIISAFNAIVSTNKFIFWVSQQGGEMHFSNFTVRELYIGNTVSGPMNPFFCTGNECELNYSENYEVSGDCYPNSYYLAANIQFSPNPLIVYITIPSDEWTIIDAYSALQIPPEYLPDSLSSPTLMLQ